jgi:integrase
MLEDYYVKPSTIDRMRCSWLAPQIESYLEWLEAHGYSRLVVYRRLPLLFHFAEFAEKKGCRDIAYCRAYIKEFVSQWLEQHGAKAKTVVAVRKHAIDAECGVRQMLQLACNEPVIRNRRRRPFPFESAVPGFADYLRSERGFAESTIRNYRRHLSEFAQYLSRTGVTSFSQLSPAVLAAFIVQHRPKVAPRTRLGLCCHLRVLLRFCHREKITSRDLSGAVGTPQIYRLDDVPRSITWDEVRRMLEAVERRTIRGRRDYAILLLLVTYGLRAHEVARLTLDDVDWKRERLQVLARKAGHANCANSSFCHRPWNLGLFPRRRRPTTACRRWSQRSTEDRWSCRCCAHSSFRRFLRLQNRTLVAGGPQPYAVVNREHRMKVVLSTALALIPMFTLVVRHQNRATPTDGPQPLAVDTPNNRKKAT